MKKNNFYDWCISNNREDLLQYYDYANNPDPKEIAKGTHTNLSWICSSCGVKTLRSPHYFTIQTKVLCKKCRQLWIAEKRHVAAVIKTNFASNYPSVAEEWDYEKNGISPDQVSYNDNHQYYWICKRCGTSFKSVIISRVKGSQCPKCSAIYHTSFPEQALFFYINKAFSDAILRDNHIGREIDIYIPAINTGIEYDGVAWHRKTKHLKNDHIKEQLCSQNKIRLIRIREKGLQELNYIATTDVIYVESGNDSDLEMAIKKVLRLLNAKEDGININKDRNEIVSGFISAKKDNSLKTKFPYLAGEWNYSKNEPIEPQSIDYGSGYNAWWICSKCGYEFQTTVNARTCKGSGCPACDNKAIHVGYNDFITWCKANDRNDLLEQWDYVSNEKAGIDINSIIHRGGNVVAYWICPNGHHFQQLIYNRTIGKGCSICARDRHMKKCRNIDTGETFNSLKEAGKAYCISPTKISMVCKGQRKTAAGCRWEYC